MNSLSDQLQNFEQERQVSALANSQKEVQALINEMYNAKLAYDDADKKFKGLKAKVLAVMDEAEIEKMSGDKCNLTCKEKTSVILPKEIPLKLEIFNYIEENYSKEVLNDMVTINAASFNSFVQREIESKILEGKLDFNFPNVKPFTYKSLGIRKKKGAL